MATPIFVVVGTSICNFFFLVCFFFTISMPLPADPPPSTSPLDSELLDPSARCLRHRASFELGRRLRFQHRGAKSHNKISLWRLKMGAGVTVGSPTIRLSIIVGYHRVVRGYIAQASCLGSLLTRRRSLRLSADGAECWRPSSHGGYRHNKKKSVR